MSEHTTAIIQLEQDSNHFKMRIGDKLITLPEAYTEEIIMAIESVSPFCVNHAVIVKEIWEGAHFEDDMMIIDGVQ